MQEIEIRLVHWYDTQRHRIACDAPGHMNSTKYARRVTCPHCLGLVLRALREEEARPPEPVTVA